MFKVLINNSDRMIERIDCMLNRGRQIARDIEMMAKEALEDIAKENR